MSAKLPMIACQELVRTKSAQERINILNVQTDDPLRAYAGRLMVRCALSDLPKKAVGLQQHAR
jgi:hypothetical protein